MDEEGYEFGEAVKEAMAKGMKEGGLMVAIQKFNQGGRAYDSRATLEDMAKAIQTSSAGTDDQKLRMLMDYSMSVDPQATPQNVSSSQGKMEKLLGLQNNPNFNYMKSSGPGLIMPPMVSTGFRQDPGYFGKQGIMINGKRYMSEDEAIDDMGIETYNRFMADGGMAGGKTYHQYHDQYVPKDEESMGYANGGGVGSMMQPKKKPVVQGGVDNYLGKQPQVKAPRKWQSSPDKPATELAYITEAEKDLIIKENIHGGLEGGPNMGPSGIMSLDSFGDVGGAGASGGDTSAGGGAMSGRGFSGRNTNTTSERDFDRQKANQRAALQIAERAQAKNLGYKERANIANRTYGPIQKYSGDGFLSGYRNVDPKTGQPLSGLAYAFDKFNPLSLIAGIIGGPFAGLATRALTSTGLKNAFSGLNEKMRGINPVTGKANTQAEYEAMVADRKTQSRIDNMTNRMLSGKNFSQKNLDALMGQVDRFGNQFTNSVTSAINRDLQINPETPQFAKSYLQSVAKSLPAQTGKQLISAPPSKPNVTRDITYGDFPNAFTSYDVEDVDLYGTPKSTMPNYGPPGIMNAAPVERADPFSFDLSNAMADASTNTNQQILDNILNESIMKNKVQPFIDNQQKKNEELDKMRQELGLA